MAPIYPPAARTSVADTLHGVVVPDPYRYLEDPDAEVTREFVRAQNELSAPYLAGLPARPAFLQATTELLTRPRLGVPWERGGRYFRLENPGELDQDRLVTADDLDALISAPRVLLDPNTLSADGTMALSAAVVSPDGALVACAVSEAGSDWWTIQVIDAATGVRHPDSLEWTKWVSPTWLPDGSGFLYWRYPAPASAADGSLTVFTQAMGAGELVLHRLGQPQSADLLVWSRPAEYEWMVAPEVSADGRWLVLSSAPGTDSRSLIEVRRIVVDDTGQSLPGPDGAMVVDELTAAQWFVEVLDDQLYLRTESGAERGRLVAIDLADPGRPWTEVVAEQDDVLAGVTATAHGFVLTWSHDAAHRLQLVGRDGSPTAELPLAFPSAVVGVHGHPDSDEIFFGSMSFARPLRAHRVLIDRAATAGGVAVPDLPSADPSVTDELVAVRAAGTSRDGTAVPMTVLRRADLPAGPQPTLLYGYGGFDIPVLSTFSALFTAWVRLGGVLAVANLRGGGEYGKPWHEAGMNAHKQNVFDDLYGCAAALIDQGITTTGQLAVHGRSNGGLLVGAALTQRPDLWAAALPTVGVLDMLRFHLFTIGWAWTSDYGSPDDPAEFVALRAYSPLHQLRPGTAYPPTLICTGDHDDRVVPAHSLKFGAELQHCQAGDAPVLLRVDTRAGHGLGKPARALAAEYADQLAFAAHHTGLEPPV